MDGEHFDYIVVGGGIMGLSTAWSLVSKTKGRIALLEASVVGHDRSSSQGAVRIARSTYADQGYVHLMMRAREVSWPRLEASLGRTLITPSHACFFGPESGLIQEYLKGARALENKVQVLSSAQSRQRYPQLRSKEHLVILDSTAGCINAAETRMGLYQFLCAHPQVVVLENHRVEALGSTSDAMHVQCSNARYTADRVILSGGPWMPSLVPELSSRLMVHRQDVGYFGVREENQPVPTQFPWIYLGKSQDEIFYGLPEDAHSMKAARHRRNGEEWDPNTPPQSSMAALDELKAFVHAEFEGEWVLRRTSSCPYTSTLTDDFIMSHHPAECRLTIAAGFSGHGFKFAPLVGEILADLATQGECCLPEFVSMAQQFSFIQEEK